LKKIGKGNFGSAYLVKNAKNERKYVLKRVDISRMPPKDVDLVRQETKLLAALEHPHIVSERAQNGNRAKPSSGDSFFFARATTSLRPCALARLYRDSFWNGANELCLVMIYCEGGDLAQAVQAGKGKIPEPVLLSLT
jgi:serine/threonine protein kinase